MSSRFEQRLENADNEASIEVVSSDSPALIDDDQVEHETGGSLRSLTAPIQSNMNEDNDSEENDDDKMQVSEIDKNHVQDDDDDHNDDNGDDDLGDEGNFNNCLENDNGENRENSTAAQSINASPSSASSAGQSIFGVFGRFFRRRDRNSPHSQTSLHVKSALSVPNLAALPIPDSITVASSAIDHHHHHHNRTARSDPSISCSHSKSVSFGLDRLPEIEPDPDRKNQAKIKAKSISNNDADHHTNGGSFDFRSSSAASSSTLSSFSSTSPPSSASSSSSSSSSSPGKIHLTTFQKKSKKSSNNNNNNNSNHNQTHRSTKFERKSTTSLAVAPTDGTSGTLPSDRMAANLNSIERPQSCLCLNRMSLDSNISPIEMQCDRVDDNECSISKQRKMLQCCSMTTLPSARLTLAGSSARSNEISSNNGIRNRRLPRNIGYRYLTYGTSAQLQQEYGKVLPWPTLAEFRLRRKFRRLKRRARKLISANIFSSKSFLLKPFTKRAESKANLDQLHLQQQQQQQQQQQLLLQQQLEISRASSLTSLLDLIEEANKNLINSFNQSPAMPPKCPPRLKRTQSSINVTSSASGKIDSRISIKNNQVVRRGTLPSYQIHGNRSRAIFEKLPNEWKPNIQDYQIAFIDGARLTGGNDPASAGTTSMLSPENGLSPLHKNDPESGSVQSLDSYFGPASNGSSSVALPFAANTESVTNGNYSPSSTPSTAHNHNFHHNHDHKQHQNGNNFSNSKTLTLGRSSSSSSQQLPQTKQLQQQPQSLRSGGSSKILCVRSHFEINNGTIYLEDSDWEMCSEISELNSLNLQESQTLDSMSNATHSGGDTSASCSADNSAVSIQDFVSQQQQQQLQQQQLHKKLQSAKSKTDSTDSSSGFSDSRSVDGDDVPPPAIDEQSMNKAANHGRSSQPPLPPIPAILGPILENVDVNCLPPPPLSQPFLDFNQSVPKVEDPNMAIYAVPNKKKKPLQEAVQADQRKTRSEQVNQNRTYHNANDIRQTYESERAKSEIETPHKMETICEKVEIEIELQEQQSTTTVAEIVEKVEIEKIETPAAPTITTTTTTTTEATEIENKNKKCVNEKSNSLSTICKTKSAQQAQTETKNHREESSSNIGSSSSSSDSSKPISIAKQTGIKTVVTKKKKKQQLADGDNPKPKYPPKHCCIHRPTGPPPILPESTAAAVASAARRYARKKMKAPAPPPPPPPDASRSMATKIGKNKDSISTTNGVKMSTNNNNNNNNSLNLNKNKSKKGVAIATAANGMSNRSSAGGTICKPILSNKCGAPASKKSTTFSTSTKSKNLKSNIKNVEPVSKSSFKALIDRLHSGAHHHQNHDHDHHHHHEAQRDEVDRNDDDDDEDDEASANCKFEKDKQIKKEISKIENVLEKEEEEEEEEADRERDDETQRCNENAVNPIDTKLDEPIYVNSSAIFEQKQQQQQQQQQRKEEHEIGASKPVENILPQIADINQSTISVNELIEKFNLLNEPAAELPSNLNKSEYSTIESNKSNRTNKIETNKTKSELQNEREIRFESILYSPPAASAVASTDSDFALRSAIGDEHVAAILQHNSSINLEHEFERYLQEIGKGGTTQVDATQSDTIAQICRQLIAKLETAANRAAKLDGSKLASAAFSAETPISFEQSKNLHGGHGSSNPNWLFLFLLHNQRQMFQEILREMLATIQQQQQQQQQSQCNDKIVAIENRNEIDTLTEFKRLMTLLRSTVDGQIRSQEGDHAQQQRRCTLDDETLNSASIITHNDNEKVAEKEKKEAEACEEVKKKKSKFAAFGRKFSSKKAEKSYQKNRTPPPPPPPAIDIYENFAEKLSKQSPVQSIKFSKVDDSRIEPQRDTATNEHAEKAKQEPIEEQPQPQQQQQQQQQQTTGECGSNVCAENRFVNKIVLNNRINQFNFTMNQQSTQAESSPPPPPQASIVNVFSDQSQTDVANIFGDINTINRKNSNNNNNNNIINNNNNYNNNASSDACEANDRHDDDDNDDDENYRRGESRCSSKSISLQIPAADSGTTISANSAAAPSSSPKSHRTVLRIEATPATSPTAGLLGTLRYRLQKKRNKKLMERFKREQALTASQVSLIDAIAESHLDESSSSPMMIDDRTVTVANTSKLAIKIVDQTATSSSNENSNNNNNNSKNKTEKRSDCDAKKPTKMSTLRRLISATRGGAAASNDRKSHNDQNVPAESVAVKNVDQLVARHRKSRYVPAVSEPRPSGPYEYSLFGTIERRRRQQRRGRPREHSEVNQRISTGEIFVDYSGVDEKQRRRRRAKSVAAASPNRVRSMSERNFRSISVIKLNEMPLNEDDEYGDYQSNSTARYGSAISISDYADSIRYNRGQSNAAKMVSRFGSKNNNIVYDNHRDGIFRNSMINLSTTSRDDDDDDDDVDDDDDSYNYRTNTSQHENLSSRRERFNDTANFDYDSSHSLNRSSSRQARFQENRTTKYNQNYDYEEDDDDDDDDVDNRRRRCRAAKPNDVVDNFRLRHSIRDEDDEITSTASQSSQRSSKMVTFTLPRNFAANNSNNHNNHNNNNSKKHFENRKILRRSDETSKPTVADHHQVDHDDDDADANMSIDENGGSSETLRKLSSSSSSSQYYRTPIDNNNRHNNLADKQIENRRARKMEYANDDNDVDGDVDGDAFDSVDNHYHHRRRRGGGGKRRGRGASASPPPPPSPPPPSSRSNHHHHQQHQHHHRIDRLTQLDTEEEFDELAHYFLSPCRLNERYFRSTPRSFSTQNLHTNLPNSTPQIDEHNNNNDDDHHQWRRSTTLAAGLKRHQSYRAIGRN